MTQSDEITRAIKRGEYRFAANRLYELFNRHHEGPGRGNPFYEWEIAQTFGPEYIQRVMLLKEKADFVVVFSKLFEFYHTRPYSEIKARHYLDSLLPDIEVKPAHRYKGKEKVGDRLNRERAAKTPLTGIDIYRVRPGTNTPLIRVMVLPGVAF